MAVRQTLRSPIKLNRQVIVGTLGCGGAEELSLQFDDATVSWALLRFPVGRGTFARDKIVAITCNGDDTPLFKRGKMHSRTPDVLRLFGQAHVTLEVKRGQELLRHLSAILAGDDLGTSTLSIEHETRRAETDTLFPTAQEILAAVAQPMSACNWILLEPTRLQLHHSGSGGLDELKGWLSTDKVLFGVLRLSFPRPCGYPPIVKHIFIHWIGPEVSAVRRGKWNSNLQEATSLVRKFCDFAFCRTAYSCDDLEIKDLISELVRLTYDTGSDKREISVDWYLEGLDLASQIASLSPMAPVICRVNHDMASLAEGCVELGSESLASTRANSCDELPDFDQSPVIEPAVNRVRQPDSRWNWLLLSEAFETIDVSSAGA